MSIYENDDSLSLLTLWFLSIMLLLCFTLTIVVCCDSRKKKHAVSESVEEDMKKAKDKHHKAKEAKSPAKTPDKTPEVSTIQPTGKKVVVEKAKEPTEFADVRDYGTLQNYDKMKLSHMKKYSTEISNVHFLIEQFTYLGKRQWDTI